MNITYFLGANSSAGFFSLYDGFPPRPGELLHIIKGGPGTGKSSFMKRLAQEAEGRGLDTECVLCSGDPDSLDGVYIPALGQAWVDGTAPHVREPALFGVDSDYVNLGLFFQGPLAPHDRERAQKLNREYKALYAGAYDCLAAAERLRAVASPGLLCDAGQESLSRRLRGILNRGSSRAGAGSGRERTLFISALSCRGELRLSESVHALCKLTYRLDDSFGSGAAALETVRREALERGLDILSCHKPLRPSELEAVLLPELSLGFVSGGWDIEGARHIRLDALIPAELRRTVRAEHREARRLSRGAMAIAFEKLRRAKALHDELEQVYKPRMDFPALDEFTAMEAARLFK